jgi:hypothetical protein
MIYDDNPVNTDLRIRLLFFPQYNGVGVINVDSLPIGAAHKHGFGEP